MGFVGALNLYLQEVDESGRWKHLRLSSNALRHTLAYNLGRLGVNPVYISIQLKHLDDAFRVLPADVTLGYGDSGKLALLKATGAERAAVEQAKELFSLHVPLAGGGAEAFRARKKAFFEGEAAAGRTVDETMKRVAKLGMPFVSVGGGYCSGKRPLVNRDGTQRMPPCLGQLRCNSGNCHQAVITPSQAPFWRSVYIQNTALAANPEMEHVKMEAELAAAEAATVLRDLGLDVPRGNVE